MTPHSFIMRYKSASVNIYRFSESQANVSNLFATTRRQGHATGVMQMVLEWADENVVTLTLQARRYGHPIGPDNSDLVRFYESLGFVVSNDLGDPDKIFMKRIHPSHSIKDIYTS